MSTHTTYLSVRPVGYFLRHLGEMILVMMVGMLAGGAILALMFSTVMASTIRGMTRVEVLNQFAVLICLVVADTIHARLEPQASDAGLALAVACPMGLYASRHCQVVASLKRA